MSEAEVPRWRRIRRRLYWLLLLGVLGLVGLLPVRAGRALGRGLARLAVRLRPRETARARRNLTLAFPEVDEPARKRLLAASVVRLGENLADTLAAHRILAGALPVDEAGPSVIAEIARLAEPGRGVFLLTGHLGCWELLGGWLARELAAARLGPLGVVTGTVRNPPVDRLLQGRRRALGMCALPREAGAAPLLRHLGAGRVAAVLLDQRTRASNRDVPFFGRPAPTPVGLARIALRRRIPVLPVAIARHPEGPGHRVVHLQPLAVDGRSEDDLLAGCNAALEELIRRNPAEWVWFHRRWDHEETDD
ncbi:MAG: lysophospholipid acyltransferase family protein [bacterium]|nr:lysophospholipid acyltransferase family protein [bacterium]